jgi:hypothetical protein
MLSAFQILVTKMKNSVWQIILVASCIFGVNSDVFGAPAAPSRDVNVSVSLSKQILWNWSLNRCEPKDTLDAPAHGFRDNMGILHVFASEPTAHPLLGATLATLHATCKAAFVSNNDPDPSHFSDQSWLSGFYSEDGVHVYAVAHSEYHGWLYWGRDAPSCKTNKLCAKLQPECDPPSHSELRPASTCWYNAVTAAFSSDGGEKFLAAAAPNNFVAGIPLQYDKAIWHKANGFWSPTNIIKYDNYFYIMANVWTVTENGFSQMGGTCLIRTTVLGQGSVWSAWDGVSFNAKMIDPYSPNFALARQRPCQPLKHVYGPSSLNLFNGRFTVLEYATDSRFGTAPGLYLSQSDDLLHWAKPHLVISEIELQRLDDPFPSLNGKVYPWKYGYFSLMDDTKSKLSFSLDNIGTHASLFYIRFDISDPPYARALIRRDVKLGP